MKAYSKYSCSTGSEGRASCEKQRIRKLSQSEPVSLKALLDKALTGSHYWASTCQQLAHLSTPIKGWKVFGPVESWTGERRSI